MTLMLGRPESIDMPAKLERCVEKVKGKKGVQSAYAICTAVMKKDKAHKNKRV